MTNTAKPEFTKSARHGGSYNVRVVILGSTGVERVWTVNVQKREVPNASARGGAYRPEWLAQHGETKGRGDTRTEAVQGVIYGWGRRGIKFVRFAD